MSTTTVAGPDNPGRTIDRRKLLWLELGAMTALYFVFGLWRPLNSMLPHAPQPNFHQPWVVASDELMVYLRRLVPAIFIVWGSGEGLRRFGLTGFPLLRGALMILVGAVVYLGLAYLAYVVLRARVTWPALALRHHTHPIGLDPIVTGLMAVTLGLRYTIEEFCIRGYLVPRLEELSGRIWVAILASSVLYAAIHATEGWPAMLIYFVLGSVFCVSLKKTGSIWPAVLVMFCSNMAGYLAAHLR